MKATVFKIKEQMLSHSPVFRKDSISQAAEGTPAFSNNMEISPARLKMEARMLDEEFKLGHEDFSERRRQSSFVEPEVIKEDCFEEPRFSRRLDSFTGRQDSFNRVLGDYLDVPDIPSRKESLAWAQDDAFFQMRRRSRGDSLSIPPEIQNDPALMQPATKAEAKPKIKRHQKAAWKNRKDGLPGMKARVKIVVKKLPNDQFKCLKVITPLEY